MVNYIARSTPWMTIQIGPAFERLAEIEQQAVIAHERGHIRHFHAWKRVWWLITGRMHRRTADFCSMCVEQEYEADAHAARTGHLKGMISLLSRLPERQSPDYPSPKQRIKRLLGHG